MSENEFIHVRVPAETKEKAKEILESMGLSTSTAIKLFLQKVIDEEQLPFVIGRTDCANRADIDYKRSANRSFNHKKELKKAIDKAPENFYYPFRSLDDFIEAWNEEYEDYKDYEKQKNK